MRSEEPHFKIGDPVGAEQSIDRKVDKNSWWRAAANWHRANNARDGLTWNIHGGTVHIMGPRL